MHARAVASMGVVLRVDLSFKVSLLVNDSYFILSQSYTIEFKVEAVEQHRMSREIYL